MAVQRDRIDRADHGAPRRDDGSRGGAHRDGAMVAHLDGRHRRAIRDRAAPLLEPSHQCSRQLAGAALRRTDSNAKRANRTSWRGRIRRAKPTPAPTGGNIEKIAEMSGSRMAVHLSNMRLSLIHISEP